jgi:SecD/SecF fusion protein
MTVLLLGAVATLAAPAFAQVEGPAGSKTGRPVNPAVVEESGTSWQGIARVGTVIALFVVPIIIGSWLAKKLRMPDYGWKFALAIGSLAAAVVVILTGEIKLGPDLNGGITLIYELEENADTPPVAAQAPPAGDAMTNEGDVKTADAQSGEAPKPASSGGRDAYGGMSRDEKVAALIKALQERVDPSGTREVSIRKYGEGQIEIIIPKAEAQELEYIERRIYTAGALEFRITASPRFGEHKPIIDIAERLPASKDVVRSGGQIVARWVEYNPQEFGDLDAARARGLVVRMSGKTPQALVLTNDNLDVTGEFLRSATPDVDETGRPQVSFTFDSQGAFRFGQLTGSHLPNRAGERYNLGILLDNRLLSAPTIESKITDRGRISGGGMSDEEVNFVVGILNAGSLPAALNKTPLSRAQISPTLGQQTIEQGKRALLISLIFVALFMAFYYRFAGFVSWFGLAANMLLIVGCMVIIKGAFTLPGLAGLVLTVGMSVDANVLIYERLREELKRGAALRMAIRNGFDRASQTIIDSNVTNLITGIVIYKIAPDNVKGFGITLVLGIAMSIYVAVFLTRLVFDVAERRHWITTLRMRQFIGETHMDFIKWQRYCIGGSLLVIIIGLLATFQRGSDILDIDFTGGSSVTLVLKDDQKMPFNDVLEVLNKTSLVDENLSLVELGKSNTRYTITTMNYNVEEVEKIIADAFKDKLRTYHVEITELKPIGAGEQASHDAEQALRRRLAMLPALPFSATSVSLLQQPASDPPKDTPPAEAAADPAASNSETATTEEAASEADKQAEPKAPDSTQPAEPKPDEPAKPAEDAAAPPAAAEGSAETPATTDAPAAEEEDEEDSKFEGGASAVIEFGSDEAEGNGGISHDLLDHMLQAALAATGHKETAYSISNAEYRTGSNRNYKEWDVKLALPEAQAREVFTRLQSETNNKPMFPLANKVGGRVASRMASDALAAIVLCLLGIIGYVWFRFHGIIYGLAAVVALIHDVLVTLGAVALSAYFVDFSEPLAEAFLVNKFQIGLTLVAAFLTIIGYSLNDTIVIFDRIREVKGKSPHLTKEMINQSVNQCFARTLLTSFTSLISVTVLYIVGGEGIHAFAFALLVGFVAGVYSTIYIANPVLYWLSQRLEVSPARAGSKAA